MDRLAVSGQDARSPVGESAAWDAVVDERERLADERERLADTREQLATERERLADELERVLDERRDAVSDDAALSRRDTDDELARATSGSRVPSRNVIALKQPCTVVRTPLSGLPRELLVRTSWCSQKLSGEELSWAAERESFVAHERDRLADARDELQDVHDGSPSADEQLADQRDGDDRRREHDVNSRDTNEIRRFASGARPRTARARADLQEIRGGPSATPQRSS